MRKTIFGPGSRPWLLCCLLFCLLQFTHPHPFWWDVLPCLLGIWLLNLFEPPFLDL